MKRSGELKRSGFLKRTRRVKPRNPTRSAKAKARNFGGEADAVRDMRCLLGSHCECFGPIVPAHAVSRGASGGRFDIVPLCQRHHDEQHATGIKTFSNWHGVDLRAEADRIALEHPCSRPSQPGERGLRPIARAWANLHGMPEGYDRDALFGWVRRRMEREGAASQQVLLCAVSDDLHLHVADGCALIDAVGWPDSSSGWDCPDCGCGWQLTDEEAAKGCPHDHPDLCGAQLTRREAVSG